MQKHEVFNALYSKLNTEQKRAVDTIDGPVMVVAGPGTGKTTILALRIANILLKTDARPENILALTFTNSGVHTMRKKLIDLIGDEAYRINIFTFHSFAEYVTKEFSFYFKNLESSNVITDLEKVKILEEIIKEEKFKEIVSSYDPLMSLNSIKTAIDSIKQEGINPEEFKKRIPAWKEELLSDDDVYYKRKYKNFNPGDIKPTSKKAIDDKINKVKEIATAYEIYQEKINSRRLYDFTDMILNVLNELEKNDNLKLDLQEQYQYLLVDEHQDTNDGQNRLIELLTDSEHLEGKANVFTVGDEKQSIYRFQGASEKTFKHFLSLYSAVEIITLKDNYRSTKNILESAHSLILHTQEDAKEIYSSKNDLSKSVSVVEFSSYKFEVLFTAKDIKEKIDSGVDPNDIAVIYRSNKSVEDLKDIFNQQTVPYTVISKENILDDINIKNIITILSVINNPNDSHNLGKSLFINFLNFDTYEVVETLNEYQRESRGNKISLFKFISKKEIYSDFVKNIKELKKESENSGFLIFFKEFLNKIGYFDHMLKSKDSREQLLKLDKLFDEIKRQSNTKKDYNLSDFMEFVLAYGKYNLNIETNDPEVLDGVKLMTAHKSKGLEFRYVYIINATRNNWEKNRGMPKMSLPINNYKSDIHDERRLFYVAMTRAKEGLSITYSRADWEGKEQDKSQFVAEINKDFIKEINAEKFEKENIDNLAVFFASSSVEDSVWNIEYLNKLFFSKKISVTAINNYVSCPIKYLFRNLIQLPGVYTANQVFGNVVHDTLEKFFLESSKENNIISKDKMLSIFTESINKSSLFGYDYDHYLEKGLRILPEYFDYYSKYWNVNVDLEKKMERDFILSDGNKVTFYGILDKIEYLDSKDSGRINIVDYKTGKSYSEKNKDQKEDLKRQLVFYHILLDGFNDGAFDIEDAALEFVEKNKKGDFERYSFNATRDDMDSVIDLVNNMANEISSGEFLKKGCDKRDCEYCKMKKRSQL